MGAAAHPGANGNAASEAGHATTALASNRPLTSLLRYSPALVLVAIVIADASRYAEADLWGHVRFGQEMLSIWHIARTEHYSYTAAGAVWRNHEWLSEVIFALAYDPLGVIGLKGLRFACAAITLGFIADAEGQTRASSAVQLAILFMASLWFTAQMQFRPQVFTYALFAISAALLARDTYRGRAPLWCLVPLMAVWANLHGGFIAGLLALGVYSGAQTVNDLARGRGWSRCAWLWAITLACALAALITPFGFSTYTAIAHTLQSPLTRSAVSEWRPLSTAFAGAVRGSRWELLIWGPALLMIAGTAVVYALTPSREDLALVAVAAVMTIGAVFAARNLALAAIAVAAPLAQHTAVLLSRLHSAAGVERPRPAPIRRSPANELVVCAIAILLASHTGLFSSKLPDIHKSPAGAVDFMKRSGLRGNVLSLYEWGGYIIWHLAPTSRVFIDSRYEVVYPEPVIRDFLDFVSLRGKTALVRYPTDFVLFPPEAKVYPVMKKDPGWRLLYEDANSALFAREDSAAARLGNLPEKGAAPPSLFPR